LKFESHIKEYKAFIRFRFFSAIFLIEIIEKINNHEKIDEIFISGWNRYEDQYSDNNCFVSELISNLVSNIKVSKLSNDEDQQKYISEEKNFTLRNKNFDERKNYILLNNTGYNFKRIIFFLLKKNYYILVPVFEKISFFKKLILRFFKVICVEFDTHTVVKKNAFHIPEIKFFYKEKDLSKVLNFRKEQEVGNLMKLQNQSAIISSLFNKINLKLVITNATRGIHGYYIEKAKEKNIPSICISHASLSPFFNKFDKIYKNIIAEGVSTNNANVLALQTKITKNFLDSNNSYSNMLDTGNLIFSETKHGEKKKILFAVTLRDFDCFLFLGIEMYYEFLDNLNLLNQLAKKNNLDILIKPHPSVFHCIKDLEKKFENLKFTKKNISKVLKNVFVTISFSSTVIEDSLCSKIPVILFDRWNRYKHCKSEENVKKKNSPIYYVNNKDDLIDCIKTLKDSDKISFNDYVFSGSVKKNISNLLNKFI